MIKPGEPIPIMTYVRELEGKVRQAREETNSYKRLAFFAFVRSIQFWAGWALGLFIGASYEAYRIIRWLV